ncbi:uncharacterized protein METZ01_LOCUS506816, partial [marine metagenome]
MDGGVLLTRENTASRDNLNYRSIER